MRFSVPLSFPAAGEFCVRARFTEIVDKSATIRMRARFKPMPGVGIFPIVRASARRMRECFNRAAVNIRALEFAMPLPISSAIEIPKMERFS